MKKNTIDPWFNPSYSTSMMKKKILGLLCFFFLQNLEAQSEVLPLAPEVDLQTFLTQENKLEVVPIFRLWGWSTTGKFAYSLERDIEGRGGTQVSYFIQDLISDKILWTKIDDTETWEDSEKDQASTSETSFQRNKTLLQSQFRKYQITSTPPDFRSFPINLQNQTYTEKTQIVPREGEDPMDAIASYKIIITKVGSGSKTVTSSNNPRALSVEVMGAFKSPYENRLAVVTGELRYVFEGSEKFYSVSGCSLTTGFQ